MENSGEDLKDKYLPLAEAAELCGCSQDYLRLLINKNRLRGVKLGRYWVTTREWLGDYFGKLKEPASQAPTEPSQANERESSAANKNIEDEFTASRQSGALVNTKGECGSQTVTEPVEEQAAAEEPAMPESRLSGTTDGVEVSPPSEPPVEESLAEETSTEVSTYQDNEVTEEPPVEETAPTEEQPL